MVRGVGEGFPKEGIMMLGVSSMDDLEIFQLVTRFRDSQGLSGPVNSGVCSAELGESEDDILSATAHNIEEKFFGNPFDICI